MTQAAIDADAIMFHLPRLSAYELVSWHRVFDAGNTSQRPSLLWAWMAQAMRREFDSRHRPGIPAEPEMLRPPVSLMTVEQLRHATLAFTAWSFGELSLAEADFIDACNHYFLNQLKRRNRGEPHAVA